MVAIEDTPHEGAVDRPAVLRLKLGQLLAPLGRGRAALAGPDEGVEREARDPLRDVAAAKSAAFSAPDEIP